MTSTASTPTFGCAFCDKKGLPILPVRYAVARADQGNAPTLPPSFGAGIKDIALPAETARYALRLLRAGYLYTYHERRKEWRGYVVNSQGFLWEFDIHAKAPPAVNEKTFNEACKAKNDQYLARCIAVKDAAIATQLWLGFSDVAWTPAVLAKHASPDYRRAHMQCIDMAAWREGGAQPHMASFEALPHIAEYATDTATLRKEARDYIKPYLPEPYTHPEDLILRPENASRATAWSMLSPMVRELAASAVGKAPTFIQNPPAWAFSPQRFTPLRDEAEGLTRWGRAAAQPWRPAIVGLPDPAGLAMELNGLAIQRAVEFTEHRDRKWKYETAQLIAGVKEAMGHGAVPAMKNKLNLANAMAASLVASSEGAPFASALVTPRPSNVDAYAEQHHDDIIKDDWENNYATRIKAADWNAYLGNATTPGSYQQELDRFRSQTLAALDTAYVGWLQSPALKRYLSHNFDTQHMGSGEAYTELVGHLIAESSGRTTVFKALADMVAQDHSHPDAWLARALMLNHDPLIQQWSDTARKKATQSAFSWADVAEKAHDQFKDLIVQGAGNQLQGRYLGKVARLLYQLSGPLTLQLNQAIDQGLASAALHAHLHLTVMGAVARSGNPDMVMVELRGQWHRKDAARTMAAALAKLSGGHEAQFRSGARLALDKLPEGPAFPYHAIVLVDTGKAKQLAGLTGAARTAAVGEVLTAAPLEEILPASVGKLASLDAKTSVVQMLLTLYTLSSAYKDMVGAKPDEAITKVANFGGGVAGLSSGAAHVVGNVLKATEWGAAPLAQQFKFWDFRIAERADWFTGVGKLLGTVGGVVGGVLAILDGRDLMANHSNLAIASIGAGFTLVFLSVATLFFEITVIAAPIGLLIAIVLSVVAYLKPNAVQDWLEQSMYFGKGESKHFKAPAEQWLALRAMQEGA